jgi:hypothetical protein
MKVPQTNGPTLGLALGWEGNRLHLTTSRVQNILSDRIMDKSLRD